MSQTAHRRGEFANRKAIIENPKRGRGYCNTPQIFWSLVKVGKKKECWPWLGGTLDKDGYGRISFACIKYKSHRLAFALSNKMDPFLLSYGQNSDVQICHKCDNPPCCNPNHMFIGTNDRNMKDMVSKNRAATSRNDRHVSRSMPEKIRRGDDHWMRSDSTIIEGGWLRKLSVKAWPKIIESRKSGLSQYKIAKKFGISRVRVGQILKQCNIK